MNASAAALPPQPEEVQLPGIIRDLLKKRGYTTAEDIRRFLRPDYTSELADPFLMTGMEAAIDRIEQAIKAKQLVAVYGDYDIDGVTSTTLMMEVLEMHGLKPIAYIPNRYDEGYGINLEALGKLKEQGVDLVISVDCGITSAAEAKWTKENGLDLIITDHHEVPEVLPQAVAVINPHQTGDKYPFKHLAGVGVAFAVARALQQRTGLPEAGREKWLLDLVALGTVCDVMPLTGENRTMVKFGLVVLRKTRRVGLVALAQSASLNLSEVRAYHLGFVLGPRLNAAGRLEHAASSLDLLRTKDPLEAQQLAFKLEELNHRRQLEQARVTVEADALAEQYGDDPVLVLSDPSWSHGVVGIVASKLAEKWQKPTLLLQEMGDLAKGSGRSARTYNLIEGLQAARPLFTKLGGHHHAAGFTLPVTNVPKLRQQLSEHFQAMAASLPPQGLREAELELEDISEVSWDLYTMLEMLEPFGSGNPQPVFGANKLKLIDANAIGADKKHLKLKLAGPSGLISEGIGFNLAEKYPNLRTGQFVDAIFYIEKNEFNGRSALQLVLLQLQ